MIPKKIHYCWFGQGKKNKLFYKCYKSWKKYFPDYEIIEWNEENFDININQYVREAYESKKWAFVSDYARLKIIYENGGIYFDTDVEVLKPFDEQILEKGYLAKESDKIIATGLGFAAYPNNIVIKYMLDDYENIPFKKGNEFDLTPCPTKNTKSIEKHGFVIDKKCHEIMGVPLYDKEYFCGYDIVNKHYIISNKTYTIHHYAGTWIPKTEKRKRNIKRALSKIIGLKNYDRIRRIKKHAFKKD